MDTATETLEKRVNISFSPTSRAPEIITVKSVENICRGIINDLTTKHTGRISDNFVGHLKEKRGQYRTLRSFYSLERAGKRIPKQKEEDLKAIGLTTKDISEQKAVVFSGLYNSLFLIYSLMNETDPKEEIEASKPKDRHYIDHSIKMNIAFSNFFIDLHERFDTSEEQIENIFNIIFDKSTLMSDLKSRGMEGYKRGILASVKGYMYLAKTYPQWKISTPDLVLDRDHGIDLIATSKNKTVNYFQIKGVNGNKVQVENITNAHKMEEVRKSLVLSPKLSSRKHLKSLGKIFDYVRNLRTQDQNANAFWMEVPV